MNNGSGDQAQPVTAWKIVLATALCMLLLMILAVVLINSITGNNWPFDQFPKPTAAATEPTTNLGGTTSTLGTAEDLGMTIEGIMDNALYTADDQQAIEAGGVVVAKVGDYELTNSMLQAFLYVQMTSFVSESQEQGYDPYTSYGLDTTKPLAEQKIIGFDVTWEQYFLHNALGTWWRYAVINMMADEAQFEISSEQQASLDAAPAQLEEEAKKEGFESADALIQERVGVSCTLADYLDYMAFTARADLYCANFLVTYEPTEEEVKAFFEINADYYNYYYGITVETGKMAAVRHVLLVPEGSTTDLDTRYVVATDEQWAAGLTAAQAMLDGWVASGAKEADFAALANEHSTDGGSNTNGGLYEGVYKGQMVENFDAWVFDETRKSGDYGLVRTEFGYHLMYYVAQDEQEAWYKAAYNDTKEYGYGLSLLINDRMDQIELQPALDKIVLANMAVKKVEETPSEETPTEATE